MDKAIWKVELNNMTGEEIQEIWVLMAAMGIETKLSVIYQMKNDKEKNTRN